MSKPQMDNLHQLYLYRGGTVETVARTSTVARTTKTTVARASAT